jgi:hypothetical protein
MAPPPTRFAPPAIQRQAVLPGQTVIQQAKLCTWLGKVFGCIKSAPPDDDENVELIEDRGALPPWGNATFLGYHWTGAWDQIKRTSFRAGGGQLGQGVYLCIRDHNWVRSVYHHLNTLLEVGYVGDMSQWSRVEVTSVMDFMRRPDCNDYDVIKTKHDKGSLNQICYRTDGPNMINVANFRVRLSD